MGRLTRDAEIRYSQGESSTAIARFSLAVDRRFRRDNDEQSADFINCVAFDRAGEFAEKYFRKANKGKGVAVSFSTRAIDERVVGDFIQLRFLLENLIDEALSVPLGGEIHLAATVDGEYIRFLFTDMRRTKTREELNQLFYPNLERMTATGEKGELRGTEYLVCKQIIRDHDEFAGKRGCRINAEPAENSGFTVYFTIPRRK